MCEDIMREVAGCLPEKQNAVLSGYSRRCIQGEHYPGIMADDKTLVSGVLYCQVSEDAWRRLDQFEGEMYLRKVVTVILDDKSTVSAETYEIKSEYRSILSETIWDFEIFVRDNKSKFQQKYSGYQIFDK